MQQNLQPVIYESLVRFRLEMLFGYTGDGGDQCVGWCHGRVLAVLNAKRHRVWVKWDEDFLGEHDARILDQVLFIRIWNPKTEKNGAWQEYLISQQLV